MICKKYTKTYKLLITDICDKFRQGVCCSHYTSHW